MKRSGGSARAASGVPDELAAQRETHHRRARFGGSTPENFRENSFSARLWQIVGRCACVLGILLSIAFHVHAATPETNFASALAARDVIDRWEVQCDTAVLWSIGLDASPRAYTFLPQMLSLKTPQFTRFAFDSSDVIVRARLSFLGEPIVQGPESYFIGASFSPSLEWWNKPRSFATFFSAGGGVGWMDAQGGRIPGGQGQDFNLNWFMHGGLKYRWNERFSASLGLMFQHISNGGQHQINPGVNALGPTLGVSYHF